MYINHNPIRDYSKPYEAGQWNAFFDAFLALVRDFKFALYNFCNASDISIITMGSEEEEAYSKMFEKGGNKPTAFIDGNYSMKVFERFLVEQRVDCYMFCTLLTHEIMHYALGHLDEYDIDRELGIKPEEALIKNTIQDAIINAMIARNFNFDQRFTKLFEQLYKHDEMPQGMLRPGSQFPEPDIQDVHDRLYSKASATGYEIRDIIEEHSEGGGSKQDYILLGGHGMGGGGNKSQPGNQQNQDMLNNAAAEVAQEIVDSHDEFIHEGEGAGGDEMDSSHDCDPNATILATYKLKEFINNVEDIDFAEQVIYMSAEATFNSELEKDFLNIQSNAITRGIVPTPFDRRAMLYRLMNIPQFFFNRRKPDTSIKAVAYIDVSGSTYEFHPVFISSIRYSIEHFERIIPFSTVTAECTVDEFCEGQYHSTGGTNDCWAMHMVQNGIKNAVVYTDGCFGGRWWQELKDDPEVNLIVVYTANYIQKEYFNSLREKIIDEFSIDPKGKYKKL